MKSVGKSLGIPQYGCLGEWYSNSLIILLLTSQFFALLVIETVGVESLSNGAWFLILFYTVDEHFGDELFNHPE